MILEGLAKLKIPEGVFYNPRMTFCRDMDILLMKATGEKDLRYLDGLSACGVRGIRVALELGWDVTLNDRDPIAFSTIQENCALNKVKCMIRNEDINALMLRDFYDWVDIDPFGSPVEYLDKAGRSALRYLSVTATDTAPLCGTYTFPCLRKYDAIPLKTDYYLENGLRILIGKIGRELAKHEKGMDILLAWTKEHYFRVHISIQKKVKKANETFNNLGFIFHCFNCGYRTCISLMDEEWPERCICGSKLRRSGPVWTGKLEDESIVSDAIKLADQEGEKEYKKLLLLILQELDVPFHYDIHYLGKLAGKSVPKISQIIQGLSDMGFHASRTRFSGTSIKTDGQIKDVLSLIR